MTEPTAVSHDSPAAMDGDLAPDGLDLLHERLRNGPPVPIAEVVDMRAGVLAVEGTMHNGRGDLVATATSTCLVID